jgi:hypothetical protein
MTKRISFALIVLAATMALSGCFDWKSIGYLEPGGSPPGASKVSRESCGWSFFAPVIYEAVQQAKTAQPGTMALKNVEITLEFFPKNCASVTAEPVKGRN